MTWSALSVIWLRRSRIVLVAALISGRPGTRSAHWTTSRAPPTAGPCPCDAYSLRSPTRVDLAAGHWHRRVVLIEVTITYLEMTSRDQLVPGRLPPAQIALDRADATARALIRSTHNRIAAPHHWLSLGWSEQRWSNLLVRPGVRCWIARVGADVIGLILMEKHSSGDVEITKFGLVPEWVGRGFGGHLLTLATRLA